jgi:acyl-CoA thioesterase II
VPERSDETSLDEASHRSDLLERLRLAVGVEVLADGHARGDTSLGGINRGGLFGGQMVAQSLSACAHSLPAEAAPDSIHVNFLGTSQSGVPVDFRVERVRDGRALQHRDVRGYQDGSLILHAVVVSSVPNPGLNWQKPTMPEVGLPDTSPLAPRPWAQGLGWGVFQIVHPSGTEERPALPLWIRSLVALDDIWLRSAAIAFWSDYGLNWAARATHDAVVDQPGSSVSATHGLWFHRPTRVERWHLFDVHTRSLSGNQGFVRASVFDSEGELVASVDQGVFFRTARSNLARGMDAGQSTS